MLKHDHGEHQTNMVTQKALYMVTHVIAFCEHGTNKELHSPMFDHMVTQEIAWSHKELHSVNIRPHGRTKSCNCSSFFFLTFSIDDL